jgi:hypothetical protein
MGAESIGELGGQAVGGGALGGTAGDGKAMGAAAIGAIGGDASGGGRNANASAGSVCEYGSAGGAQFGSGATGTPRGSGAALLGNAIGTPMPRRVRRSMSGATGTPSRYASRATACSRAATARITGNGTSGVGRELGARSDPVGGSGSGKNRSRADEPRPVRPGGLIQQE